jgi:phosphoglycolate phosphatase
MASVRAIALDLDGTLIDSAFALTSAVNCALTQLQLPTVSREQVAGWIGNGIDKLLERALQASGGAAQQARARQLFDAAYEANLGDTDALYPGVATTLAWLAERLPLALITNKHSRFTLPLLQRLGIAQHFKVVVSGDTTSEIKPHPLPLLYAAQVVGIAPEHWLMVGDSRNDLLAARAAGMGAVGLTYGYNYGEDIRLCGPDYCLDHFSALQSLLAPSVTHA